MFLHLCRNKNRSAILARVPFFFQIKKSANIINFKNRETIFVPVKRGVLYRKLSIKADISASL